MNRVRATLSERDEHLPDLLASFLPSPVARNAPVAANAWHVLRVKFKGSSIHVLLDGKAAITLDDAHIVGAGEVGVWTKADSVTAFDDFAFGPAARR